MQTRKPTHPGEVLYEDVLKPLKISISQAAKTLGISRKTLSELVHGKCKLTPEMAVRIALATNTTPESWITMQAKLDIWNVMQGTTLQINRFQENESTRKRSMT